MALSGPANGFVVGVRPELPGQVRSREFVSPEIFPGPELGPLIRKQAVRGSCNELIVTDLCLNSCLLDGTP